MLQLRTCNRERIAPALYNLHQLSVEQRKIQKLLLLTYKALNDLAPNYISDLINLFVPGRNLRSALSQQLVSPSYNISTYGFRALSSAAAFLSNSLPREKELTALLLCLVLRIRLKPSFSGEKLNLYPIEDCESSLDISKFIIVINREI